jgi:hypothetical protein
MRAIETIATLHFHMLEFLGFMVRTNLVHCGLAMLAAMAGLASVDGTGLDHCLSSMQKSHRRMRDKSGD